MLVALATPRCGVSQPLFDRASNEAERQVVERIQELQSQRGPQSADLIGPLMTLGLLYEESGRHDLSAAAIEQAWQLVRVNYGLHSFDQAPLIRQRIRQEEAGGNLAAAWNLEQALLTLARRQSDDLRTVPILREIADRRMDVLDRYVDGDFPPEIVIGCYYRTKDCASGHRSVAIQSILSEAQRQYSDAIRVLLGSDVYASDELRALEMQLVSSSFLYGAVYGDGRDYTIGRESLRRLAAYEVASSAPRRAQTEALILLADWDLLYSRSGDLQESALASYRQAYRQLEQIGLAPASVEQLFAPETPVVLPTFLPNPLVTEKIQDAFGYIDVAFEVTKQGKGRKIEILDTTTNATRAAERRLAQLILRSRFRPRVIGGQFADSAPIVVRYYLNE